jgi:hypothetical protein
MAYVRREEEKQKQKAKIMLSIIKQVNRGRLNQYPIGPQLAQPPALGYKRSENQRIKQKRWESKCFKYGEPEHFKRECPEWERECRETTPTMTFDEE